MKNNSRDENLLQKMHAHIRMVFLLFFCCLSGCVSPNIQEVRFTKSDALALVVMGVEIDAEDQLKAGIRCGKRPFGTTWRGFEQFEASHNLGENMNSSFFLQNTVKNMIVDPKKTKFFVANFVKPGDYFLHSAGVCAIVYTPKKPIGFTAKAGEIVYLGLTKLKTTYNLEYNEYHGLQIAGVSLFEGKNRTVGTPTIQMPYFHPEGREEAEQWLFSTYRHIERQPLKTTELKNFPESIKKDWDKQDKNSPGSDRLCTFFSLLSKNNSTCGQPKTEIKPVWEKKS